MAGGKAGGVGGYGQRSHAYLTHASGAHSPSIVSSICLYVYGLYVYMFPQNVHELVFGADLGSNLHHFSSRGRTRGSRGPGGPQIGHKPGAKFVMLSSLRSAY